ncbi:MarR family winged helix-turn-helix transcriptional regulator [Phenylobacterium koreense]|uniref:DNA-binding MarR family transcriptional regulator n=1 Tax=Phenylobacterium koreense TaxID=266125 RepID=A0ABV2ENN9_9CAUL
MTHDLTLEDQLCYSLYATSMAINRIYKPLLDRLGITYPQYLVLSALWEEDGRTVGAIAERLSLESSTITPLVKRLEMASLVTRARQADDERRVLVSLTDRGRALKEESRCLGEALFTRSGMKAEELISLNREVLRLRSALTGNEIA